MAFDLPRSPRSLRFTGEVRSLAERPRLPSSNGIDTPTRMKTVRGDGVRPVLPSFGDDADTLCMDRDALDVARKPQPMAPTPGPDLPVPGFRSLDDVLRQQQSAVTAPHPRPSGPFPLGVWLVASLALAVVSFFVAPAARAHLARTQDVASDER